ncbi:MAG: hypothetical protein ACU0A6_00240 [Shimia sp.]|jgi:hypothetical protein|uniref:hypothetical protein n=1 Tax=Shimia sp. TaxID=1954381 RepID=UPI004058D724
MLILKLFALRKGIGNNGFYSRDAANKCGLRQCSVKHKDGVACHGVSVSDICRFCFGFVSPEIQRHLASELAFVAPPVLRVFVCVFIGVGVFYFMAVTWHRSILIEHGRSRSLPIKQTVKYLARSIGAIFLFAICSVIPLSILGSVQVKNLQFSFGDIVTAYHQGWTMVVFTAVFTWLFWFWYLAISPGLVRTALGEKGGIFRAFDTSRVHFPMVRAAAAIMTLCMLVYSVVGSGLGMLPVEIRGFVELVFAWLVFVVSISLLTQFYIVCDGEPDQNKV